MGIITIQLKYDYSPCKDHQQKGQIDIVVIYHKFDLVIKYSSVAWVDVCKSLLLSNWNRLPFTSLAWTALLHIRHISLNLYIKKWKMHTNNGQIGAVMCYEIPTRFFFHLQMLLHVELFCSWIKINKRVEKVWNKCCWCCAALAVSERA